MQFLAGNLLSDPSANNQIPESVDSILLNNDIRVERIITNESFKTPGDWYDQEKDEWVVLLQGKAELEFENDEVIILIKGDYIFIPAHKRHRVFAVSKNPNCIWLAIHGHFK